MASGDTKTNQYLDIAAHGDKNDFPASCCETRSQTLIREVGERVMDLEDEVHELENNPDVTDIVDTYADLQAYDTSKLTDKDIIRVLNDETHDGQSTYYRYNKQSDSWTYIGAAGDYYTKTAADAKFQDKLTAGSNITISDNIISATDTTYSAFTGTDGTAAGTSGLVPAPATADAGKYLKADGTWAEVSGGGANVGEARKLTTADYDFPVNNPKGVLVTNLKSGIYYVDKTLSSMTLYLDPGNSTVSRSLYPGNCIIVGNDENGSAYVLSLSYFGGSNVYYDRAGSVTSKKLVITSDKVINNLTSTLTDHPLSANQGKVLKDLVDSLAFKNAGAPTTATVGTVGQLLEDTTNGKLYICTAIIPGTDPDPDTYTWVEVGSGGSITPVQTTGTSTTDVMSQKAVTSMVFADPSTKTRIRIGNSGSAGGTNAISIGTGANVGDFGNYGLALGSQTRANAQYSVAVGSGASATTKGQFDIGTSHSSATGGYNNSAYRLLTGLHDGQSAHDAATVGQITPTTGSSAPTTATVGRLGQIQIDTTTNTAYMCVAVDDVTPAYTWKQITA